VNGRELDAESRLAGVPLRRQLAAFTLTRLVVSTANRTVYPFLPVIARGLGVSIEMATLAVFARSALGLLGPVLGSTGDRHGRRLALTVGLAIFGGGMALVALLPTYPLFFVGLLVSGAGTIISDSAVYAYLGDRVPYERRGMAMALVEIGWSGAYVVGIPVSGWLIGRRDWSAPFLWLALLGWAMAFMLRNILPRDSLSHDARPSLRGGFEQVLSRPAAMACLLITLLLLAANQSITIIYGIWFERSFGLRVEELGAASAVIGLAGISGVLMVALLSDRLGKRHTVALGIGLTIIASLGLPVLSGHLTTVLADLFVLYFSFEVAVVAALPLMSELVPGARATLMAGNVAAIAAGDAIGALIGPQLFKIGLVANTTTSAALNLASLAVLILLVRTPVREEASSARSTLGSAGVLNNVQWGAPGDANPGTIDKLEPEREMGSREQHERHRL
jgi:predicted MFS family arabinose efflux permease